MNKYINGHSLLLMLCALTFSISPIKSMEQDQFQYDSLKYKAALIVLEKAQYSKEEIDKLNIPEELKQYAKNIIKYKPILDFAWDKNSYNTLKDIIHSINNSTGEGMQFSCKQLKTLLTELTEQKILTEPMWLDLLLNFLKDKDAKTNYNNMTDFEVILLLTEQRLLKYNIHNKPTDYQSALSKLIDQALINSRLSDSWNFIGGGSIDWEIDNEDDVPDALTLLAEQ